VQLPGDDGGPAQERDAQADGGDGPRPDRPGGRGRGAAHETTMTAISAGLNRDLPRTPAVARMRTVTVAVKLMTTNAATIQRVEPCGPV
jgi:hypothetical protein